ncbi:hypothetical protein O988_03141 [Pseudogymnoascus sp. VKM F-3808]|nr:hypothetical protein O988_03141 [Pseudogymnoascus sp. VKM F-3808]
MEGCRCSGSRIRPACSKVIRGIPPGTRYNTHEDVSRLIFTRDSASKYLGREVSSLTTATTTITDKTFTLFPLLPPELRLKIWQIALSIPRLVVISSTTNVVSDRYTDAIFVDNPPLPLCFLACRESRDAALQRYKKCYATDTLESLMFYFNFEHDQFLLGGPDPYISINYLTTVALPNNAHKVRYLHITLGNLVFSGGSHAWEPLRERFTGLKELIISFPSAGALHPYEYYRTQYSSLLQESKIKFDLYDCVNGEGGIVTKRWNPAFELKFIHYPNPENRFAWFG